MSVMNNSRTEGTRVRLAPPVLHAPPRRTNGWALLAELVVAVVIGVAVAAAVVELFSR